jgi:hypothetical protein
MVAYPRLFPDFGDKYAAYMVEDKRASGASQAEIDDIAKQGEEIERSSRTR